ncbi:hypothetical protein QLQ12_04365 [Actinoplanes sp. NEAU-A12]|uniref:PIN domain-containing protein n=1 Tax=Actinoplanes sandaracinus TaxID=3045177 RepID=A0ABT6WDT1_9ACTN|nr:hypothetical protein [Actinoplanes sandaracinus]MDI6097832.1 hypothetical protein [Actinoplanes sandaracinus]
MLEFQARRERQRVGRRRIADAVQAADLPTDPEAFSTTRIFVDINVLFPFSVMDLMLALTEDGVREVLWTQAL